MPSFEESLLGFQEAEKIRLEHALEGLSMMQLGFKHGLPFRVISDILHYKIHKPEAPAPAEEHANKTMYH